MIFFELLKRNFPVINPLHKIFNRNNIKLSYSCMPSINSIINKFNITKLKEKHNEALKCNCKDKAGCPLKGKCQYECIVYKVEVYSGEPHNCKSKKVYFGSTQGAFKHRYYNHRTSFTHKKYKHSTSLSNYVWVIKNRQGIDPILKWEVVKKCRKYRAGDRDCILCNEEKLAIASYNNRNLLNQRSEILNACRHKRN